MTFLMRHLNPDHRVPSVSMDSSTATTAFVTVSDAHIALRF
jgi:hypothetical protein